MSNDNHQLFMERAVNEAIEGCQGNIGLPFGCIVVKDGVIVGRGCNQVTSSNDPTAHAEVVAIRDACKNLSSYHLDGCVVYASCEPCPMCFGAIYWARISKVYFGCSKDDAAGFGFPDDMVYKQISMSPRERSIVFEQVGQEIAYKAFEVWSKKMDMKDS